LNLKEQRFNLPIDIHHSRDALCARDSFGLGKMTMTTQEFRIEMEYIRGMLRRADKATLAGALVLAAEILEQVKERLRNLEILDVTEAT
jgi:hypothetical protein